MVWRWQVGGDKERDEEKGEAKGGKAKKPREAIIDREKVKTKEMGGNRGDDTDKRNNGRERHNLVDNLG